MSTMDTAEALARLRAGFSEDYVEAFGTLVATEIAPGTYVCPACVKPCGYTGHASCQREYVRPEQGETR